jgi:hypothetical protein
MELKISPWNRGCVVADFPNMDQYVSFAQEYTKRKLTYPSDGLQAVTGLLSLISPSFSGRFISGLPEMFFNEALLWQPRETMQRRQDSRHGESLPSWSWVGWEGAIMKGRWLNHYTHTTLHKTRQRWINERKQVRQVTPLVDWCYGNTSEDNHPITLYPFASSRHSLSPISARYISCRTKRGFFPGGLNLLIGLYGRARPSTKLVDKRGKICGSINVDLVSGVTQNMQNWEETNYELVAISQGSCLYIPNIESLRYSNEQYAVMSWGNFDEHENKPGELARHIVEFYYVLWIEWVDGIAYRKGLGRVLKRIWDEEAGEDIDLILG